MFLFNLFLICIALIGVLVAVAYICDRFQIGVKNTSTTPTPPPPPPELYGEYKADYFRFGNGVWEYLKNACGDFDLVYPSKIEDIFCTEICDRISIKKNRYVFCYKIKLQKREDLFEGGGKRIPSKGIKLDEFATSIERNLPSYLKGGYYFSGSVSVWSMENGYVHIEIMGVDRKLSAPTENIVL